MSGLYRADAAVARKAQLRGMRIGFLMDPLENVRVFHDSTFALMLECQRPGLEVRELRQEWLYVADSKAHARMRTVEVQRQEGDHVRVAGEYDSPLSELVALFLRKDPPGDVDYLRATRIVELGPGPRLINHPRGLRSANEKLFVLRFPDLIPPTLVSREIPRLREFVEAHGGDGVVKPLDGCGGQGVLRVRKGDPNLSTLLELATSGGRMPRIAAAGILAAGLACGSGSGSTGATLNGVVRGQPMKPVDAVSSPARVSLGAISADVAAIVLSDVSGVCAKLTANTEPKNGKALVMMLADVDRSSFAVTAPSGPGTFDVFNPAGTFGIPPAHLAVVRFGVHESCAEVPEQSAVATSGAVKLTSVSAGGYAGTYTIGLETGEQITGEFHAASCPGLATYLATPTHSCGG